MNKKLTILILIFIAALAVSCKRNESSNGTADASAANAREASVAANKWEMGFALRVNTGLYALEEDTGMQTDKTRWIGSFNLGDSIMIGEVREATFAGDNRVYDFVEVRDTTGREGYAFAIQVAAGGKLAVVTDDRANLFRTPAAVDVTGFILSRRTVLVYYPETLKDGLVEIRAYDSGSNPAAYRHGNYVRMSALSEKRDDIQSSILLQTALPLRDTVASEKARKDALLETALLDYPNSVFHWEIYEIVNPSNVFEDFDYNRD